MFEDTKVPIKSRYTVIRGQTTQWPTDKVQKDKQRSTKPHTEN